MSGSTSGRTARYGAGLLCALWIASAGAPTAAAAGAGYMIEEAWPGAAWKAPIGVVSPQDGTDRLFVLERAGRIQLAKKYRGGTPVARPTLFLDITSLQMPADQIENSMGGLLNMAVPPDFAKSGRFYVLYGTGSDKPNDPYRAVVASYRVSASNPDVADPASGQIVLQVQKRGPVHFGGGFCFGNDGMLYYGVGDAAEKDDPNRVAQNMTLLDGKILRLDVRAPTPGRPYSIPGDNPWPNVPSVRPEIFAYGMRNPWRMSFDRTTGLLWVGDVGQKKREEIDVVPRAGNMGWGLMEGNVKVDANADPSKYVAPVYDYGRETGNCVIGGVVYRGQRCPALRGNYVFGDSNEEGKLFVLPLNGNKAAGAPETLANIKGIASIDEDAQGEIYVSSLDEEKIYTLVPKP